MTRARVVWAMVAMAISAMVMLAVAAEIKEAMPLQAIVLVVLAVLTIVVLVVTAAMQRSPSTQPMECEPPSRRDSLERVTLSLEQLEVVIKAAVRQQLQELAKERLPTENLPTATRRMARRLNRWEKRSRPKPTTFS